MRHCGSPADRWCSSGYLLLIDGNDDTFIQHLLLDFCIRSLRFAESASIAAASIRASISGSLYPKMLLALSV